MSTTICMMRADIPDDMATRCCDPAYDYYENSVGVRIETSYADMTMLCEDHPVFDTAWLDGKLGRIINDRVGHELVKVGEQLDRDEYQIDEWRPPAVSRPLYRIRFDSFLATMRRLRDIGGQHPDWKCVIH